MKHIKNCNRFDDDTADYLESDDVAGIKIIVLDYNVDVLYSIFIFNLIDKVLFLTQEIVSLFSFLFLIFFIRIFSLRN